MYIVGDRAIKESSDGQGTIPSYSNNNNMDHRKEKLSKNISCHRKLRFHSSCSPAILFVPDPCELTYTNTLLLSNAALSLGCAFICRENNQNTEILLLGNSSFTWNLSVCKVTY